METIVFGKDNFSEFKGIKDLLKSTNPEIK
jgi:hypothetical protein